MDDKRGCVGMTEGATWMAGIKEALGLQCNLVIPVRDAEIQEFYQVGNTNSHYTANRWTVTEEKPYSNK